jgi:HEAT repeat protein
MRYRNLSLMLTTLIVLSGGALAAKAADNDQAAVDKAIGSLKSYDFGTDRNTLKPIDDAVVASYGMTAARKELEGKLAGVLSTSASRDAQDYVCRVLRVIGTADSVPALAKLLGEKDLSHSARYALQSIPAPEAGKALRDALPKLSGPLKVGVISSLGARRDAECVAAMANCLTDTDTGIAAAAAHALGSIADGDAAKALTAFVAKAPKEVKPAVTDACLVCAERLLTDGKKTEALTVYKLLSGEDQPKHVRLAATNGMLAALGKKGE